MIIEKSYKDARPDLFLCGLITINPGADPKLNCVTAFASLCGSCIRSFTDFARIVVMQNLLTVAF